MREKKRIDTAQRHAELVKPNRRPPPGINEKSLLTGFD
jgi:hypothetical protein